MAGRTTRRGRIAALATGALVAGSALETALVASAERQWGTVLAAGPARPDEVVGAVLATAAVLLGAWLAVTTLASLLGHLPGRLGRLLDSWSRSWSPAAVRRVAAVLVGASVSGVLAPGSAVGAAPPSPSPGFTVTALAARPAAGLDQGGAADRAELPGFTVTAPGSARPEPPAAAPGWVPQRPVVRPQPAPDLVTGTPSRTSGAEVVVLRGDSLWSIVARRLGPEATDAEVAGEWPRWYAANRSVIGDDPDILLPGQVLHAPRTEAVER